MEEHYVFKSLFEDKITQVSSIGAERWGLWWNACATGGTFSAVRAVWGRPGGFLSTVDVVVLNCVTQFNIFWRVGTFPSHPMSKCRRKTCCITVAESLFLKNVSTANALCPSDQHCMMTEGFKPLYPVMCVSSHHLQRCRHGAKFKLSNYLFLTLYKSSLEADSFGFFGGASPCIRVL
jgi:hypothetical protein